MKSLIRDGNLTPVVRNGLVVIGLGAIFLGVRFFDGWLAFTFVTLGLVAGALGVYSGRAALFGLRPLGESEWRKAKRTYERDKD